VFPEAPTSLPAVLSKMALDQTLMAPLMTAAFFGLMKVLEGRPREAGPEVSAKLAPTLRANWAVWPAAHLVNFALVPAQQRILYINLISVSGGTGGLGRAPCM
jgi:protein Mpv17